MLPRYGVPDEPLMAAAGARQARGTSAEPRPLRRRAVAWLPTPAHLCAAAAAAEAPPAAPRGLRAASELERERSEARSLSLRGAGGGAPPQPHPGPPAATRRPRTLASSLARRSGLPLNMAAPPAGGGAAPAQLGTAGCGPASRSLHSGFPAGPAHGLGA